MTIVPARRLTPEQIGTLQEHFANAEDEPIADRPVAVLVGLTGAGKTTTVERLDAMGVLSAVLPDRRALTDRLILPMMTGGGPPPADRVERFRLTAAFKERHPGGMGDVLGWLVLPGDLPPGPVLFDGLRGEAEVAAAAEALPLARFVVLDCAPEARLWRLCGRGDPFDGIAELDGTPAGDVESVRTALLESGFAGLAESATVERACARLAAIGTDLNAIRKSAAIIVEESRHYDPAAAIAVLLRVAPERTLVVDTGMLGPDEVAAAIAGMLSRS